jgi:glycerol-3-phosphate dehydrogenase
VNRTTMLAQFAAQSEPWDILIIGGGATGIGCAVDSAARGYRTLLLEQADFGKGTSSRSTKLVHGGVRYLEQGNIALVMEALRERGTLRNNAPHLVTELPFIVPNYEWWEAPFYGLGLKVYNLLAGKYNFGPSKNLSREETLRRLPTIETDGLRGGVVYHDGQFDDARLLINLAQTAADQGAVLLNYCPVTAITRGDDGFVSGAEFTDIETGETHAAEARIVINAAGPWVDTIRKLADTSAETMVIPSQGAHIVLDRSFLPGDSAIMVPHTSDGRVMFAIPWHNHTLVGTTDTEMDDAPLEPIPFDREIDFILSTASLYLDHDPTRADILSVFAGIRPLVKTSPGAKTSSLSRSHTIHIDSSGLLTIAGGKWTTYRKMAQDTIDQAALLARLPEVPSSTAALRIHGAADPDPSSPLSNYGSDAGIIDAIAQSDAPLAQPLHPALPYTGAEAIFAARHEMARTVEDVLARRTRALFLNARAALAMAPGVAELLARELNRDEAWQRSQLEFFDRLARGYLPGARP